MKVAAIIVADGQAEFPAAVEALRLEADHVMAIQNSGEERLSCASVINPVPLSFAENLNLGWQTTSGFDIVLIANPDIVVPAGWRPPLEEAFEADAELGAASLPIDNPPRPPNRESKTTPLIFTAIRRSAVEWHPPFDERLVNACEDVDMSYQLHRRGWLQRFVDGPVVRHNASALPRGYSFKSGQAAPRSDAGSFAAIYGEGIAGPLMSEWP